MIAVIIGVIVIIALGVYAWTAKTAATPGTAAVTQANGTTTPEIDTVAQIQADYSQIDTTNLDKGLSDIDNDLK